MTPTTSASMMASAMNWSEPGAASTASDEAVSSDTTATGPVPSWLELPHRAATATGRKAAYKPVVRGQPGQLRVGHRLRNQHQGHGQACHEVGLQHVSLHGEPAQEGQAIWSERQAWLVFQVG